MMHFLEIAIQVVEAAVFTLFALVVIMMVAGK